MSKSKSGSGVRYNTPLSLSSQARHWNAEVSSTQHDAGTALDDEDVAFFRKMTAGVQPLRHEPRAKGPEAFTQDNLLAKLKTRCSDDRMSQNGSNRSSRHFPYAELNRSGVALVASEAIAPHLPTDGNGAPYFCRAGSGSKVLHKVRKRTEKVEATLDLHGFCAEKARVEFERFFRWALGQGMQCVKVVHGKGLGSVDQVPVLKLKVRTWLIGMPIVYAFHEAPTREGGGGAVLVLLRAMD